MKKGICPKCLAEKPLTRHHVLPRRHFRENSEIVYLCRDCHSDLEKLIPYDRQSENFYIKIVADFLKGVHDGLDEVRMLRRDGHRNRKMFRDLRVLRNRKQNRYWIPSAYAFR